MHRAVVVLVALCVTAILADTYTLKQVQVVFRHGDRTPMSKIKESPVVWTCSENTVQSLSDGSSASAANGDRYYRVIPEPDHQTLEGNCSSGQLTSIGVSQHNALGAWLRSKYVDDLKFLSGDYSAGEVYIRSTDVPRTIQSVQALMNGFFPHINDAPGFTTNIPIQIREKKTDDMSINPSFCPRLDEVIAESIIDDPKFMEKVAELLAPISFDLMKAFHTIDPLIALEYYDNLNCRTKHNLPLPSPLSDNDMKVLSNVWNAVGQLLFNSTSFGLGSFYSQLLANMHTPPTQSLLLFSGHDTTVGPLLVALGAFDGIWPPYASNVVFELLENQAGAEFVRVIYNNVTLPLPGCQGADPCPLSAFTTLLSQIIPKDMTEACALKKPLRNEANGRPFILGGVMKSLFRSVRTAAADRVFVWMN